MMRAICGYIRTDTTEMTSVDMNPTLAAAVVMLVLMLLGLLVWLLQ